MILAFQLLPLPAVIVLLSVLLISLLRSISQKDKEIHNQELRIVELETSGSIIGADDQALTRERILGAIRANGFVPSEEETCATFNCDGEVFQVATERIPYLLVGKWCSIKKSSADTNILREAANEVNNTILLGSVYIADHEDELDICFYVTPYENKYGHFKDSLPAYMHGINDVQKRVFSRYNDLKSQKDTAASPYPEPACMKPSKTVLS